jgi:hypothetical protein
MMLFPAVLMKFANSKVLLKWEKSIYKIKLQVTYICINIIYNVAIYIQYYKIMSPLMLRFSQPTTNYMRHLY